jgi:peptide/nickel transport system substrate-binding protein
MIRPLRSALPALLAIGLLASCARSAAPERGAAPGELRIAINALPPSMADPFRGNGRPGSLLWFSIFDGLTRFDEQGVLQPGLATSWAMQSPTVWRFTLRQGVRYSNGRPFNATTVVRVFGWLQSKEGKRSLMGGELRGIDHVVAVDPFTVDVVTKKPDPILPKRMTAVMMVEPDTWKALGPERFQTAPVGTGAFMVTDWQPSRRRLTMSRSPTSWRPSKVEKVTFVELPNGPSRAQALLSGDVEIAFVGLEDVPRLRRNNVPVITVPSMQVKGFTFHLVGGDPKSPVQDKRVRQALNYAIDKTAISERVLEGKPAPSGQPATKQSFGYDPTIPPYPYDPAMAKTLLKQAGYPNGFSMVLNVMSDTAPGDDLISQAVAEYWRQIGVKADLKVLTFADHMRRYTINGWTGDAFSISWNTYQYYDVTRPMEDFSCHRPKPFFCDKAITAKLDAAEQIMDDGTRLKALQALARDYREAAPNVFIVEHRDVLAYSPRIGNVRVRHRVPVYEDVDLHPASVQARN